MCTMCAWYQKKKARRRHQVLWTWSYRWLQTNMGWSYRWLQTNMWVLEVELGSSASTPNAEPSVKLPQRDFSPYGSGACACQEGSTIVSSRGSLLTGTFSCSPASVYHVLPGEVLPCGPCCSEGRDNQVRLERGPQSLRPVGEGGNCGFGHA